MILKNDLQQKRRKNFLSSFLNFASFFALIKREIKSKGFVTLVSFFDAKDFLSLYSI